MNSTSKPNSFSTGLRQNEPFPLKAIIFLFAFLALFHLACLPLSELRASDESIYAAIAGDMLQNGHYLQPHFDGVPCQSFVLYPWLTLLCSGFHLPTTVTVRLPALLSTFGLAILAGVIAARHRDRRAGWTAAMITLTCFATLRIGIVAQTETLHAFLLAAAWFWLYEYGPQKQRWQLAWGGALAMVFLDTLNVGIKAPILFYLPLLVTPMPPRMRRQLQHSAHIGWLVSFALLFYLWVQLICHQPVIGWNAFPGNTAGGDESFLAHFLTFPIKCILYTMPWGVLVWTPFCLGLRPLEPPGSISGFLRALVICPFVCYWLLPGHSPLFLLCSLAPLAILISFHAQVVLHRYDLAYNRLMNFFGFLSIAAVLLCALFWLAVAAGRIQIMPAIDALPPANLWLTALAIAVVSALVAWRALTTMLRGHQEFKAAWIACAARFAYAAIALPLFFVTLQDRRYVAQLLRSELPPPGIADAPLPEENFSTCQEEIGTVYLLGSGSSYPAQMFYLGRPIKRISHLAEELPRNEEVVYLLARSQPLLSDRSWTQLSPPVNMNLLREFHLELQGAGLDFNGIITRRPTDNPDLPRYQPPDFLRLYRGKKI